MVTGDSRKAFEEKALEIPYLAYSRILSTMNSNVTSEPSHPASTVASPASMEHFLAFRVATALWTFYPPIVLLLGTFGNVMSIVVMSRMTSRESTINMFFIAIALGDMLVLCTGMTLAKWLDITFNLHFPSDWPLLMWITPSAGAFVSWMLVCVTMQRVVSVVWPHQVKLICTRRSVGLLIGGVTVFLAGLYSHTFYCFHHLSIRNGSDTQCEFSNPDYTWFLGNVFAYVDLVVYSLLPFISLVLGNSVLVWKLAASTRKARQRMTETTNEQVLKRSQANTSVTLTVLVVSLTFIMLTLPSGLFYVLYYVQEQPVSTPGEEANVYLFFTLSFLLADSNSAVNFYLYCLTGRRFREEFVKIVCFRKTRTAQ